MTTKQKVLDVLENPKGKLVCVDLDGVLCEGEWWGPHHPEPAPNARMIEYVQQLRLKGAWIVIYTARQPQYYPETLAWLIKHGIFPSGLAVGIKPACSAYIDDKAINVSDV